MDDALTPEAAAAAVDALCQRFDDLLTETSEADWSRPTPCTGWDVGDLVGHVSGFTTMFAGVAQPEPPEGWTVPAGLSRIDTFTETAVAARRGRTREETLAELAAGRRLWVEGLRGMSDLDGQTVGPTGPMSHREFVEVRMFDLWHHLWDLHQALDRSMDLADDSTAARLCHTYVLQRVPWLFGKRAGAPEGATVTLRLGAPLHADHTVIVLDGRAGWAEIQPDADTVSGPAASFSLVMSGRVDPDEAVADGLHAEGPLAERLLTARLFG